METAEIKSFIENYIQVIQAADNRCQKEAQTAIETKDTDGLKTIFKVRDMINCRLETAQHILEFIINNNRINTLDELNGFKSGAIDNAKISIKEQALIDNGFFVGGLTDKQIEYYYQKMFSENKK